MRTAFYAKLTGCYLVCLATGLGLGWVIWGRAPDYPDRIAQIMQTNCLPFPEDLELVSDGLIDVNGPDLLAFADEATGLRVSFSADGADRRACTVSDILRPQDLQIWADIFERMQIAWAPRITVWNGEPPVTIDLTREGVGSPHLILRPRGAEGHYMMLFRSKHEPLGTDLTVGYSKFNAPIGKEEAL
ncbi:MAG: hypothetical protein AAFO97_17450 [Pseudomonadota bacterium]